MDNGMLFKPDTAIIKMFYMYRGIKLFNDLPYNIEFINSTQQFKLKRGSRMQVFFINSPINLTNILEYIKIKILMYTNN